MGGSFNRPRAGAAWSLADSYGFISTFLYRSRHQRNTFNPRRKSIHLPRHFHDLSSNPRKPLLYSNTDGKSTQTTFTPASALVARKRFANLQCRCFHDYFVTHLPSSSLHPDSRSSTGPHHKLPRAASTPHSPGDGTSPAAPLSMVGTSRELTVVRIPLRSAKHHFGVSVSRGTRPYNEDTYQAGTIEIPAFAKRAPVSLNRSKAAALAKERAGEATSADSARGDPQVFYFGVFDGHGGSECSEFLRDELQTYIEVAAEDFELRSSLKPAPKPGSDEKSTRSSSDQADTCKDDPTSNDKEALSAIPMQSKEKVEKRLDIPSPELGKDGKVSQPEPLNVPKGDDPTPPPDVNKPRALELEQSLVSQWKETVGGYFRRFKPEYFSFGSSSVSEPNMDKKLKQNTPISIETVLMYAFLRADLDFIVAQASKPDPESKSSNDLPLNNDEILGEPSRSLGLNHRIGGAIRFKGGSTASIAMISTPTPTPFWNPASPSTLVVAHVGDTRILLCETSSGLAVPLTTNHHPSSPVEGTRLRRYAATFVTDSFGEERMSGLANTRAFGDMRSKRIGVSAEPELVRLPLGPAQYSFLVLMSDGVSGTLSDQEIVDVVKEAKTPDQGAKDVVQFATEVSRDGDNATCLVVRLGGWERRGEGGTGALGTKEVRDFRRMEAQEPRSRRT